MTRCVEWRLSPVNNSPQYGVFLDLDGVNDEIVSEERSEPLDDLQLCANIPKANVLST